MLSDKVYGSSETCDFSIYNIAFLCKVLDYSGRLSFIKYIFANLNPSVS